MKLRVFVLKFATSVPHLTFYEHNSITKGGITIWHTARGPCAQMERHLFSFYLHLAGRCFENPQSTKGPVQCKSCPSNNMLVSRFNHLLYHFSITILLHLASFTRKNTFEKNFLGKCSLNKLLNMNRGLLGPLAVHTPINDYFHDKTKISKKIFEWIIIYC